MKKSIILLFLMIIFLTLSYKETNASSNYSSFQELTLTEGKLLKDMNSKDLASYYKKVDKRKFAGWNIEYINKEIKCYFISETVFSYYNDGTSPITYNYSLSSSEVDKFSISGSGSVSYSLNGSKSQFKHGLQAALKLDSSYQTQTQTESKETLKIDVDPHTCANLYIMGEGLLTNGVCAKYMFFIRDKRGGFEYFILQTQYPRLEKVAI